MPAAPMGPDPEFGLHPIQQRAGVRAAAGDRHVAPHLLFMIHLLTCDSGAGRSRTGDLPRARRMLSQLSYDPTGRSYRARTGATGLGCPVPRLLGVWISSALCSERVPACHPPETSPRPAGGRIDLGPPRATAGHLPRKEVIQPHLPVRLPCYDFTPITGPTLDTYPPEVGPAASGVADFRGVTGGVYKAREHIHRGVLTRGY